MENKVTIENKYIKADDNIIINENCIRWVKKMDYCLHVCSKPLGCGDTDTIKICKSNNPDSFDKLDKFFN